MNERVLQPMDEEQSSAMQAGRICSIFAVVVVYRLQPLASKSVQTLLASAAANTSLRLGILVADNTPGGQQVGPLPAGVQYRAYPDNPGLARPYNDALRQAEVEGFDWLLTLDQDTSLPISFLPDMESLAWQYQDHTAVAAIAPRILDQGRLVSPFRFWGNWLPRMLPLTVDGLAGHHLSALNSASLLRVKMLRQAGGYDERFPLHNSDTRLYQRLDAAGRRLAVAGKIIVPHELSILDRQNRMSTERYRHMLEDECAFWDWHMGLAGRMERLLRLAGRYVGSVLRRREPEFRAVTLQEIRRRLLTRRGARMAGDAMRASN